MVITKLFIIDWYDGVITSITSLEKDIYIFHCIQVNSADSERTYYCVKIDEKSFKQIEYMMDKKFITRKDWNMINLLFEMNNKYENVFLSKSESLLVGSDIIFTKAKSSDIINIKFPFDFSILY
jgi:hypothetical protein